MANLAGFCCAAVMPWPDDEDPVSDPPYVLPVWDADIETMLIALVGRTKGFGDWGRPLAEVLVPHVSGVKREREEGCCRTQKTNVLLIVSREH